VVMPVRSQNPAKNVDGRSVLFWALDPAEDPELFRAALKAGADPNICLHNGQPIIFKAAFRPQPEFLQALIDHGAQTNVFDPTGENPLAIVLRNEAATGAKWYHPHLDLLLTANANPNSEVQSEPALIWCVRKKQNWALRPLIEAGASLDKKNRDGEAAYDIASRDQVRYLDAISAAQE
jgi:ankyrin repeat protein